MNPEDEKASVAEQETPEVAVSTNTESEANNTETKPVEDGNGEVKKEDDENLPYGVKKRFATLTKRNKDYEQQIEIMKQEQAKLKEAIDEFVTKQPKPTKANFATEEEYLEHLAAEKARQIYDKEVLQPQKLHQNAINAQQKALEVWQERVQEVFEDVEDFGKVVSKANVEMSNTVLNAIMESDEGPRIAYYLAQNPNEAERIKELSGKSLDKAILKLELKLEGSNLQQKKSTTAEVSKAPKPMGKPADKPLSNNPESIDDWIAKRRKQIYGR